MPNAPRKTKTQSKDAQSQKKRGDSKAKPGQGEGASGPDAKTAQEAVKGLASLFRAAEKVTQKAPRPVPMKRPAATREPAPAKKAANG